MIVWNQVFFPCNDVSYPIFSLLVLLRSWGEIFWFQELCKQSFIVCMRMHSGLQINKEPLL
jgi:hypothetical protein